MCVAVADVQPVLRGKETAGEFAPHHLLSKEYMHVCMCAFLDKAWTGIVRWKCSARYIRKY